MDYDAILAYHDRMSACGSDAARGAVSAASVAHLLDQRARARRQPPPISVVLPPDPRVRDLRVTPALANRIRRR